MWPEDGGLDVRGVRWSPLRPFFCASAPVSIVPSGVLLCVRGCERQAPHVEHKGTGLPAGLGQVSGGLIFLFRLGMTSAPTIEAPMLG